MTCNRINKDFVLVTTLTITKRSPMRTNTFEYLRNGVLR